MQPVNLRSFAQKFVIIKKLQTFFRKSRKNPPKNINAIVDAVDTAVWKEIDCLSCANCCKMTPTFTNVDIKRIAAHFNIKVEEFKDKWLRYDKKDGDWVNVQQPCQFLNLENNMCSIYEVRPSDCSDFLI
jgi:hypothetical protein